MCVRPPSPPRIHPSMGMWLVCTSWRLSRVLQGTGEGMGLLQRTCVRTYAPGRDGRVAGSWFSTEVSERPPHWCPEWLCQRTRPPTLEEGALCATPTAASVLGRLATDGHSPRCEVVPRQQFGFALLDTRGVGSMAWVTCSLAICTSCGEKGLFASLARLSSGPWLSLALEWRQGLSWPFGKPSQAPGGWDPDHVPAGGGGGQWKVHTRRSFGEQLRSSLCFFSQEASRSSVLFFPWEPLCVCPYTWPEDLIQSQVWGIQAGRWIRGELWRRSLPAPWLKDVSLSLRWLREPLWP